MLSEKSGDYVRLIVGPGDPPESDRIGHPHRRPLLCLKDFKVVISSKTRFPACSGVQENWELLLASRWLARATKNHGGRVVILVDAKVVVASATKGRSSSVALRKVLRHIGALTLATGMLPRL
jgi:hypothetical protein